MNNLQMLYKVNDIGLRLLNEEDLTGSNYLNWFNDPDVTRVTTHGTFAMTKQGVMDFISSITKKEAIVFGIYWLFADTDGETGKKINRCIHVGNASLQSINWINKTAEFAIIIGETDQWGKGIASIALWKLLHHAFNKCGLHRVWSGTSSHNPGMQRVFEKLGFKKEGVFREAKLQDGKFVDIYEYAILEQEYRIAERHLEVDVEDKTGRNIVRVQLGEKYEHTTGEE